MRTHLTVAMSLVAEAKKAVLDGDVETIADSAREIAAETDAAAAAVSGRLWSIAEILPFGVGENLAAVRIAAQVTDDLADDVLVPVSGAGVASIAPKGGAFDLVALAELSGVLDRAAVGVQRAESAIANVSTTGLMPEVAAGFEQLADATTSLGQMVEPARSVIAVLPAALGADGPRTYLIMFQGNSEARSLGGNAAVYMTLTANGGRLTLDRQANSSNFHHRTEPVTSLDPEAVAIYGDKIGRYTPDFTMVPDFPTAASIFRAWWDQSIASPYDATISFDPVALSYLLGATGPLTLPTGDVLDESTAVPLLLNGVYYRYEDPEEQDAFFAFTADAVFHSLTGGGASPVALMRALARAADEGRLLYSSDDAAEISLLKGTRISGQMETTDSREVVGVYINDNTGSKKSYYLDLDVKVCLNRDVYRGAVTLASRLSPEEAERLPEYIAGPYYDPEDISTFVVLYGPAGSSLSTVSVDGQPATVLSSGTHLGRPAVKVEIVNHLQDAHTVSFEFVGVDANVRELDVWHTPMARGATIEQGASSCAQSGTS